MEPTKTPSRDLMRRDNQELHDKIASIMAGEQEKKVEEKKDTPKKKVAKLKGGKSYSDAAIALAVKKLS